jgi:uncharacterized protein with PhoU and TrkA domain
LPNPDPDLILRAGDQLLALGNVQQLEMLEAIVSARSEGEDVDHLSLRSIDSLP